MHQRLWAQTERPVPAALHREPDQWRCHDALKNRPQTLSFEKSLSTEAAAQKRRIKMLDATGSVVMVNYAYFLIHSYMIHLIHFPYMTAM